MASFSIPLSRWFYQGQVAAGALVNVYQVGTTTPVTVYSDGNLSVPITNPVVCDSNGEAVFYVATTVALRLYVTTSGGTLIRDISPVYPDPNLTGFTGTGSDLNYLSGANPGQVVASKAVVADGAKSVTGFTSIGTSDGNISPHSGLKNLIIGGDFATNPWQRGTNFSSVANGAYTADRWRYAKTGTMVHTISKDTDAPSVAQAGHFVSHSLLATLTTPQDTLGATDFCAITQRIEGYNFQRIAQRTFVVTFWVKATQTGTYCVALRNSGTDRTYLGSYSVISTNTWEFKTVSVTASPSAGTWNYANGVGLEVAFSLAAGVSLQASSGSWQTGSFYSNSSQVNGVQTGATSFRLALVQVEAGPGATLFDERSVQEELSLSQRYFCKTYPQGTDPATNTGTDAAGSIQYRLGGVSSATHAFRYTVAFPVTMRATPTVTWYSTDGTSGNVRDRSSAANVSATSQSTGDRTVTLDATTGSTTDPHIEGHMSAAAEL